MIAKKRRVLIIVENLPVPFDRRVWQEAQALQRHGYQVSVICPKGPGHDRYYEVVDGIAIYRHWLPGEADTALGYAFEYTCALLSELVLSARVAVTRGFDVLHACNPPDTIFLIGWLYKLFGKRFIFDHHDINPELYEAKFDRRDFFYEVLRRLERWTFNTADVSIATNESYRRIAIQRGGMDPGRVFVVRSGPDLSRVRSVPPDPQLRRGRRFLVGYVGVIGKQEGIELLLESIAYIRWQLSRDDIQYVIVGSGTELTKLKSLSEKLAISDCVEFPGRVPDDVLWQVLSSADICVNPDRANEMNDKSTMNKIVEYMALGKPIVQFDLAEGRNSAGAASLYARPNDVRDFAYRMCELLDNSAMREKMGLLGRERVESELSWERQVPALLAAYDAAFSASS